MTKSELIEAMARAIEPAAWRDPPEGAGPYFDTNLRHEQLWAEAKAEAALSAIEQAGFVVVPVQPLPEMTAAWYRYKNGHRFAGEEPARDTSDYGAYAAMIEAGRLK